MKSKRINKPRIVLIAAVAVILYCSNMLYKQQVELNSQRAARLSLSVETAQAEETIKQYERDLSFTKTEAFIEKIAREKFGYVYDGEYKFYSNE